MCTWRNVSTGSPAVKRKKLVTKESPRRANVRNYAKHCRRLGKGHLTPYLKGFHYNLLLECFDDAFASSSGEEKTKK